MTDTPRRWDRLTAESDPAFEAFAAYLAHRLAAGRVPATIRQPKRQRPRRARGPKWSPTHHWVSRRAAYVEFTVRECQDATQVGLVQMPRPVHSLPGDSPPLGQTRKPHSAHAKAAIAWSAPLSEIRSVTVVLG